jgi:predicted O-linked N-acetylglucosamine transferase (SPINDLY family)
LPVFAWKPAPIQVSWLGYWATTGVNEIDYILGDPYAMPKEEAHHFTEKIWHLPESFLCMTEPKNGLEVKKLPALSNNFITFGCFNNISKMNDKVIEVRSKILKAVPNSKLFLKSKELGVISEQKIILDRFLKFGISKDRLIFEKSSQRDEYFKSYNKVDIALSPFPYGGVTTSIDGLWMGVPVLSRKGDKFLSHVGETIAYNCGLENWIANSDDEYISKAIEFSADLKTLSNLREVMREKVLNSPIFNSKRFSRNFEKGLWDMWKKNKIIKKFLD